MSPATGLDPRARYALLDEPGHWRYVGQAWYVDDQGRRVEHDHVRLVQRVPGTGETREVWVDPATITGVFAGRSTTSGVFALGESEVAG